jgi:hypothetical protein
VFVRVFVHCFEGSFVFSHAGLKVAQHFELLLEQQPGRSGKLELVEEAKAAFAEEIAALGAAGCAGRREVDGCGCALLCVAERRRSAATSNSLSLAPCFEE